MQNTQQINTIADLISIIQNGEVLKSVCKNGLRQVMDDESYTETMRLRNNFTSDTGKFNIEDIFDAIVFPDAHGWNQLNIHPLFLIAQCFGTHSIPYIFGPNGDANIGISHMAYHVRKTITIDDDCDDGYRLRIYIGQMTNFSLDGFGIKITISSTDHFRDCIHVGQFHNGMAHGPGYAITNEHWRQGDWINGELNQ